MIVIIPEGIEAATSHATAVAQHNQARSLLRRLPSPIAAEANKLILAQPALLESRDTTAEIVQTIERISQVSATRLDARAAKEEHDHEAEHDKHVKSENEHDHDKEHSKHEKTDQKPEESDDHGHGAEFPSTQIGLALILGFITMFLIDRLPQHASESLQSGPQTQQFSMDTLGDEQNGGNDEEAQGFLGALAPTPKSARSMATTVGLVIHAAADGIALGASSTADMKLGFIIFFAIMIHKAPAAFGLTSVLLKQGLSKRAARAHLIVFSLAAPVGALTTWLLITILGGNPTAPSGHWWTGMLLLFSGGTFLYVAMHAMQEAGSPPHEHSNGSASFGEGGSQRKAQGNGMRDTVATTIGMLLPLLTQFGHHH
ncbi:hypothetical protein VHEMI09437 [[Torrubiella] hemipterigena]|nr:hypothetical protein VHEMI09437 [[Torrubiella] hemipterigena]